MSDNDSDQTTIWLCRHFSVRATPETPDVQRCADNIRESGAAQVAPSFRYRFTVRR
jgi:hypothetical protein